MNLWLLACLVACFVGPWDSTVHAQGAFEDCCLAYHRHVGWAVLRHARVYQHQDVSGSCNLPAVIFYLPQRRRMVCGNPQDRGVQKAMRFLDARTKKLHNTRMTFHGSHAGRKKLSSGTSGLPSSMFSDPTHSSKRNASLPAAANPAPSGSHQESLIRTKDSTITKEMTSSVPGIGKGDQ
ncbi:PREDICTED: C-C motif chemokine 25 isoform X2 [Galeopterus variegatus]|uniref:C-C motif chemokine 25 isoform X2 n=1 Tax=Galeopterus variegatus TaxID=482537 RepID=A0ABM0RCA4_GALVR|nr:PREDICTED: C-C motif chemokine 25 isoform X2 [Galeopterus variegatus]